MDRQDEAPVGAGAPETTSSGIGNGYKVLNNAIDNVSEGDCKAYSAGEISCAMIDAALAHAEAGFKVLPTHWPVSDGDGGLRCSCRDPQCDRVGKHPRIKDWQHVATSDPKKIREWWSEWPDANIGVLCGSANGITVIDIDPRNGGDEEWKKHLRRHQPMPLPANTAFVKTGSGGDHIYFERIEGVETSHSVVGPGIDVQADGAYVLGVGSLHASGKRYEAPLGGRPQPAPEWLVELLKGCGGRGKSGGLRRKDGRTWAEHLRRLLDTIEDGDNRDGALFSVGKMLWDDGVDGDRLRPLMEGWAATHLGPSPKTDADFRRIVGSIKRYPRDPNAHIELADVDEYLRAKLERAEASGAYIRDAKRRIVPDVQENIWHALDRLGCSLSYDEFDDQLLIEGPDNKPPRPLTDAEFNGLWLTVDEDKRCRFRPRKEFFRDVVENEARKNNLHPVRDYLADVEPTWDGESRIDTWLIKYGGAEDTPLNRAVGHIVLVAAVRRIRKPGAKFDELLTLLGAQGDDKSQALQALAVRPEWFSDSIDLGARPREMMEQLNGRWIVEAAELVGMRGTNTGNVKAQLSRQIDRARRAYGHFTESRARQCVMIGTGNKERYLHDATGNRRHWPVDVGRFDVAALKADRDQLWAEAAQAEAARESIRLDESLWQAAAEVQDAHMADDPWLEVIGDALGDHTGRVEAEDIWGIIDMPKDRRTQEHNNRIGDVMRRLGWRSIGQQWRRGRRPTTYAKGTTEERKVWLNVGELGEFHSESDPRPKLRVVGDDKPEPRQPNLHLVKDG